MEMLRFALMEIDVPLNVISEQRTANAYPWMNLAVAVPLVD